MDREVVCKLCWEGISAKDTNKHLGICVEHCVDIFDPEFNDRYADYCILAFILGLTPTLNPKIVIKNAIDTIFVIYEYFYFNGLNSKKANRLWGLDQFCRTVLSHVDEPEEKSLRIVPGFTADDFKNESVIADLNVIFSEAQINLMYQWETLFCAE